MASRLRKVRRLRGSRTHGWGQVGQHRRTGAKGGSGMAGLHKHKWSYTVKYAPDHFGSNKWHPPNPSVTNRWINLSQLGTLSMKSVAPEAKSDDDNNNNAEIDLASLGYDKLLGEGQVKSAYRITVPRASNSAIEKIRAAGGEVTLTLAKAETEKEEEGAEKTATKEKGPGSGKTSGGKKQKQQEPKQ